MDNLIALSEIADELGAHKATLHKVVGRLGIVTVKRRDPERGNQMVSCVAVADANRIRSQYQSKSRAPQTPGINPDESGEFYLLRLEPEYDPGRFKVGFTTDRESRLRKHRCSAPFAVWVQAWPCRRVWERTAIACGTQGSDQLHTEVFRTESLDAVVELLDKFFTLMPSVEGDFDE